MIFLDIGLDIQDAMGRHEVGLVENSQKDPINNEKGCVFTTNFFINKVGNRQICFFVVTNDDAAQKLIWNEVECA